MSPWPAVIASLLWITVTLASCYLFPSPNQLSLPSTESLSGWSTVHLLPPLNHRQVGQLLSLPERFDILLLQSCWPSCCNFSQATPGTIHCSYPLLQLLQLEDLLGPTCIICTWWGLFCPTGELQHLFKVPWSHRSRCHHNHAWPPCTAMYSRLPANFHVLYTQVPLI